MIEFSLSCSRQLMTGAVFSLFQSSVPVTVRFPQELLGPSTRAESSLLLMIIFGVLLGVLILVIVTLALYICK